jgi:RNA polymerase sigma factor (sigma-70 family)|nr:MAG TPA: RNA polymerase sigma factor [Caudoviricetes sp.]
MFSLARKALVQVIMPVRAPFYVFLSAVVLRRCWSGSPPTQHRNGGHIMFNRKSSYALNKKDPNAIVYMDANEAIIRLTREDFASEEEFLKWKSWSDGNYHTEDNQDVVEGKHNTSIDDLSEAALSIPAIDVVMDRKHEKAERHRAASAMVSQIRDKLTETQFRRLWMYYIDGMTVDEIGRIEGIRHQNISKSIGSAMKKIKKFFP